MFAKLFRHTMTMLSLTTAMGVFMHDSRVDKAAVTAVGSGIRSYTAPATIKTKFVDFVASDAHAHPDHNTGRSLFSNTFTYQQPSIAPRRDSHHKQLLRTLEMGGRHAFDNANLPILES
ncbi:MAG: hypothetical protein KA604_01650 [Candidatus Saccharimonas sp.]|jgi:hypothetical protein|nr:hypothetical protein [Candidatus Saccharimonas sp.]